MNEPVKKPARIGIDSDERGLYFYLAQGDFAILIFCMFVASLVNLIFMLISFTNIGLGVIRFLAYAGIIVVGFGMEALIAAYVLRKAGELVDKQRQKEPEICTCGHPWIFHLVKDRKSYECVCTGCLCSGYTEDKK